MNKKLMVGLFVCSFFILAGCQPKAKVEERKVTGTTYICHQAISKIKIDGFLDEKDWQRAKPIKFYRLERKDSQDHKEAESPASGKLLWDKDYLYIGIEAKDKDIWSTIIEHDGRLWQEDVLEAFFKPNKDKPIYFEFEFNPKNVSLDLIWPKRDARSLEFAKTFESNLKSAVKVYGTPDNWKDIDNKWVLEVAIPLFAFKEETTSPKIGDEWSFALCRYDYSVYLEKGLEYSSTAKLSKLNFHFWEDYDRLLFSE
ncbi:MAG: carbohydrate-binding family 9-like protein [bacterium]